MVQSRDGYKKGKRGDKGKQNARRMTEEEESRIQCRGWAGLPGVWGEEVVAREGCMGLLLPSILHNPQNGRVGVTTQAVGLAPVFPRLQVTEAIVGTQPKPQKRCSQCRLPGQARGLNNIDHQLGRS